MAVPKPQEKTGSVDPRKVIPYLARRARNGNLVIMVGSGASASAGLAPWSEIGDVFREILNKKNSRWVDVPELASIFVERLEKQLRDPRAAKVKLVFLINNILKFSKPAQKYRNFGKIYPRLVRLPVSNFYTTNWDQLLQDCLFSYSIKKNVHGYIRSLDNQAAKFETNISHGETRDVVYLHGTLQGPYDQLIITSDDYKNFQNKAEYVFNRLLRQFEEDTTMLCVGYSFSDLDIAEYIQKAMVKGHPGSNVFALFGKIEPKDARTLWRYRGIFPVSLTSASNLIEQAVCHFIDELIISI